MPGGGAAPRSAGQVRAESRQPLHPQQRHLAQRAQLGRLGVGAEKLDMFTHRVLHLFVARQFGAPAVVAAGLALGGGIFHALLDDQPRGGGGDLLTHAHGNSTAPMRATMVAARPAT